MIKGIHSMFYSSDPEGLRTFLRDKLGFSATDIGEGWLIFKVPDADMGVHPADKGAPSGTADVSFYCDNISETVNQLKTNGVTFKGDIEDHGYGLVTFIKAPGDFLIQLYEPRYQK